MLVICAMNQKGGSGKTTLLLHLLISAWLKKKQRRDSVSLIDLDPQRSAEKWSALRVDRIDKEVPVVVDAVVDELRSMLQEARTRGVDILLVDTPAVIDKTMIYAAAAADIILVPTRTSQVDLDALEETLQTLENMRALEKAVVVINAPRSAEKKPKTASDEPAVRALVEGRFRCPLAPVVIGDLAELSRALDSGRGIGEVAPRSAAAQSVDKLLEWLLKRGKLAVSQSGRGAA